MHALATINKIDAALAAPLVEPFVMVDRDTERAVAALDRAAAVLDQLKCTLWVGLPYPVDLRPWANDLSAAWAEAVQAHEQALAARNFLAGMPATPEN